MNIYAKDTRIRVGLAPFADHDEIWTSIGGQGLRDTFDQMTKKIF